VFKSFSPSAQPLTFVPLSHFLRPAVAASPSEPAPSLAPAPAAPTRECVEAIRAARRFRAGLSDALEAALPDLLRRIARDVVARELRLAPSDVRAIVASAVDTCADETVLAIRVNPRDLEALCGFELARVGDDALEPGDVRLTLQSGTIDLTLSARLEAALAGSA
jgi:flagellar biosynthesis/type III secretory pathway protein FliH